MGLPIRRYGALLATYLRPQRTRVALLAALLLGNVALQLVNPQIVRSFIDSAQSGADTAVLLRAALAFIGIALVTQVLGVAATYVGQYVGWTATNALRSDLAAHCLRLDMGFHKARTPGELIERVDGDVNALSNFFSQFAINVLSNAALMVGVLALLFAEDWRVGGALTAFALVSLTALIRIQAVAIPYWREVRERSAGFFGFVGELLVGTADIRANGATDHMLRRFYAHLRGWLPIEQRASLAGYSVWMTSIALFAIGNAVAFGMGAWLYSAGAITLGTVFLIFYYTELLQTPLLDLRRQLEDLQKASASIARIEELFATTSRLSDGPGAALPAGPLAVVMDGVSFGYADEDDSDQPYVLSDVSFSLAPGRVLGLLGRTGSGKTTLARLLLRLYDPQEGSVRIGGVDARGPTIRGLRRHVGMVTQDVQLFQASVRDNLAFFDPAIGDKRIEAVLEELGLGPWLRGLPQGLDSELESGNSGLSAGEAQLLAFARLFLKDPGLVILDEASSRLDPATERLLERAVGRLLLGRTGVIIAHRLETVQRADEILILDGGRIVEYGPRAALAADPSSRLAALLRAGMEEVLV
ncbi:MAG: ABC transporter ATP-binding protein [Chloroflexales bacterium]|nr:ABC transporter ATP-binding protein [Chloroflexales bacterium]